MPPEAIATVSVQTKELPAPKGFPFRLALPLGQLLLCAVILLPLRGFIFYEFGLTRLAGPPLPFQVAGPLLRPFVEWSVHNGMETVAALNFPAGLVQLPFDIFSTEHRDLMPRGMDFKVWRAVTWPIVGVVFWWVAGRGADALIQARGRRLAPRIGWLETVVGSLIMAGGATLMIGIELFSGSDRASLQGLAAAAGLWTLLGGLTVSARILQWRIRKKLRAITTSPSI